MEYGSTPTEVYALDTGTYRASKLYFIMPSVWELHFRLPINQLTQITAFYLLTPSAQALAVISTRPGLVFRSIRVLPGR